MSLLHISAVPNLDLFVVGVTTGLTLILGYLILSNNPKSISNRAFFVLALSMGLWAISNYLNYQISGFTQNPSIILWTLRLHLFLAVCFATSLFSFSYVFPHEKILLPKWYSWFLIPAMAAVAIISLTPFTLAAIIEPISKLQAPASIRGWGMILFAVSTLGLDVASLYILFKKLRHGLQNSLAARTQAVFFSALLTIPLILLFNLILPNVIQDFDLIPFGALLDFIFALIIGYSIFRYHLLNVRIVFAEIFSFALLVLSFVDVIRSATITDTVVRTIVFLLLLPVTILLIRAVRKEVKAREEIERLAKDLKKANERLKVLDKMKSEFVSIASHQLRSPLTAIRGYASMLLEGSYGKLTKKTKKAVERIADSSRYMALSVEDYLNVSRIEAGNMKYETADFNLKEVAEKIVDEVRPTALKKGLVLLFRSDCDGSCAVHADVGKIRQVILNLIDNAMKYTPKGSITVTAHDDVKKKKMYVSIKDTGVGMSKDTQEEVFHKFIRAKNANEINVTGTGLGLFVAKKMVEEMGGRIWAESAGEGKGSTFHIELPLLPGKFRP